MLFPKVKRPELHRNSGRYLVEAAGQLDLCLSTKAGLFLHLNNDTLLFRGGRL